MQLRDDLWLEGGYYIDFDQLGQLRIVGSHNHLHYGAVGLEQAGLTITDIKTAPDAGACISISLKASALFMPDPVMGHIRKVRSLTEFDHKPTPSYAQVVAKHPTELEPNYLHLVGQEIIYRRLYGDQWYGVRLKFNPQVTIQRAQHRRGFMLSATSPISFEINADTSTALKPALESVVRDYTPDFARLGSQEPAVSALWKRTEAELTHLIQYNKTSGFAYGTVFPRDWMESADLGGDSLLPSTVAYMYQQSLLHVDEAGVGWHEDIVGEHHHEERERTKGLEESLDNLVSQAEAAVTGLRQMAQRLRQLYINRNMVDIEPRYLMALDVILESKQTAAELKRLRRIAEYVMHQASDNALITFKRLPDFFRRHRQDEEYFRAGNWRDSDDAFRMVHPVLAPYDVNVVFYPQALQALRRHHRILKLSARELDSLIGKWAGVREWYKFRNPDGTSAYALALYDIRTHGNEVEYKKLKVNHLDEAYELFYGQPTEEQVTSFCLRLLSPEYFYTASGPTVVGAQDGYSANQYHGRVIWTKQTAFAVAGLEKQLQDSHWSNETKGLLAQALEQTAIASINAFVKLNAIPELHYDHDGQPRLFTDQTHAKGPQNTIQLWSAAGARRIIEAYLKVATHELKSRD